MSDVFNNVVQGFQLGSGILDSATGLGSWIYNMTEGKRRYNEQFEYAKKMNDLVMQREDSSVQRRAADLNKAGINPLLAGLGGANATPGQLVSPGFSPVPDTAPTSELRAAITDINTERHLQFSDDEVYRVNNSNILKINKELSKMDSEVNKIASEVGLTKEQTTKVQKEIEDLTGQINAAAKKYNISGEELNGYEMEYRAIKQGIIKDSNNVAGAIEFLGLDKVYKKAMNLFTGKEAGDNFTKQYKDSEQWKNLPRDDKGELDMNKIVQDAFGRNQPKNQPRKPLRAGGKDYTKYYGTETGYKSKVK